MKTCFQLSVNQGTNYYRMLCGIYYCNYRSHPVGHLHIAYTKTTLFPEDKVNLHIWMTTKSNCHCKSEQHVPFLSQNYSVWVLSHKAISYLPLLLQDFCLVIIPPTTVPLLYNPKATFAHKWVKIYSHAVSHSHYLGGRVANK